MRCKWLNVSFLLVFLPLAHLYPKTGKVYLVLGSDTAIWDGMSVNRYNCTYNLSLYTDPTRNAAKVMDASWRQRLVDSDGTPMKLTWWMMAGNIFRYATNRNIPLPNIMTLYLMKKYYGDFINQIGDELSLHYHTFVWTDYDQDGRWYWNQAHDFNESRDDFDVTLCQFLLEEKVFPVSFRSGWHYMDNHWQNYLNELLPFSMHNDWPHKRTSDPEPIDNIYDWSLSPAAFIPWHPSLNDYRLPGDGPGWNVRSLHLSTAAGRNILDSLFFKANQGLDQVACIWGHLPEEDFLTNLVKIDSLAHRAKAKYPEVDFYYCSAVEAMQRWLGTTDTIAPNVTFEDFTVGDDVYFRIQSDEPIFQPQPFLAVKDIYENYYKIPCQSIGSNYWQSSQPVKRQFIAKAGIALCDSVGNQRLAFINYLPDDIYVDNSDFSYREEHGLWQNEDSPNYWGRNIRTCLLPTADSAVTTWQFSPKQSGNYNLFAQIPSVTNTATILTYQILSGQEVIASKNFNSDLLPDKWNYIATLPLDASQTYTIRLVASGKENGNKKAIADVIKISALVRPKDLSCSPNELNFGEVGQLDTAKIFLRLNNFGYQPLTINAIAHQQSELITKVSFPLVIAPWKNYDLEVNLIALEQGLVTDTLVIHSDDPLEPIIKIPVKALITSHFFVIDNEDLFRYREYGKWNYSVAQAYGPTSRYAALNQNPRAYALFSATIRLDGKYDVFGIVPTTVNASNKAFYSIKVNGVLIDSFYVDQNQGSGDWVKIKSNLNLRQGDQVELKIADTGLNTNPGAVLRADAIKFRWTDALGQGLAELDSNLPTRFELQQNFPNPFNGVTLIQYALPTAGQVQITVFDMLGRVVLEPINRFHQPGYYTLQVDLNQYSSGFYFCRLISGSHVLVKKMLLLK